MKKIHFTTFLVLSTTLVFAQKDFSPRFSNKGDKIAFYSYRNNGEPEIFVINADGKNLKQITPSDGKWAIEPRWSPDDESIGFSMGENMGSLKVNTFNIKNKETMMLPLKKEMTGTQFISSWTQQGLEFALKDKDGLKYYNYNFAHNNTAPIKIQGFEKYSLVTSNNNDYRILSVEDESKKGAWLLGMDGTTKKLTNLVARNIVFSKKNKMIFFEATQNGNIDIYSVRLSGKNLKRITTHESSDYMPSIDPTGKFLVFSSGRSEKSFFLYKKNLKTGQITQITGNEK
ncbi:hypothetical protein [Pontimicrobium sp. SW4]|uniref:DUF5050 domain-containing protein n=1 Tax=Pontimicrobium sp. SW4 TaxID=3153519 RepID=A0AAU7BVJ4_9FLAO